MLNPLLTKNELLTSTHFPPTYLAMLQNLRPKPTRKYKISRVLFLFFHRRVHKLEQRSMFFSEVTKVDLARFGDRLFNYLSMFSYTVVLQI